MSKGTFPGGKHHISFCVHCLDCITPFPLVILGPPAFFCLVTNIHNLIMLVIPLQSSPTCLFYPGDFSAGCHPHGVNSFSWLTQTLTSCLSFLSSSATVARKAPSSMSPPWEHATVWWIRIDQEPTNRFMTQLADVGKTWSDRWLSACKGKGKPGSHTAWSQQQPWPSCCMRTFKAQL